MTKKTNLKHKLLFYINIIYYLNKSVYTLPNKLHKGLKKKKMFYALNNFTHEKKH